MRGSGSFGIPLGRQVAENGLAGYYVDFTVKARSPEWPPPAPSAVEADLHVTAAQWALGCVERFLAGEGDVWLEGARNAAHSLAAEQVEDGGWVHDEPFPHTFELEPPWLSAMAQGEGASLLARVAELAGEPELLEPARRAIEPLLAEPSPGGLVAELPDGSPFPQEYPTEPASHVLNGGIFAIWGIRDLAIATGEERLARAFERGVDALAANVRRWDTGFWSRYDLFPHPLRNVASPAYHELHIHQLAATQRLAPRAELAAAIERFRAYAASARNRRRALLAKVMFRLAVPRNPLLARRMPWAR